MSNAWISLVVLLVVCQFRSYGEPFICKKEKKLEKPKRQKKKNMHVFVGLRQKAVVGFCQKEAILVNIFMPCKIFLNSFSKEYWPLKSGSLGFGWTWLSFYHKFPREKIQSTWTKILSRITKFVYQINLVTISIEKPVEPISIFQIRIIKFDSQILDIF